MRICPVGLYRNSYTTSVMKKNNASSAVSFSGDVTKSKRQVLLEAEKLKEEMKDCYVDPEGVTLKCRQGVQEVSYDRQRGVECVTLCPEKSKNDTEITKTAVFKSGKLYEIFVSEKTYNYRKEQDDEIKKEAFYFDVTNGELKKYVVDADKSVYGGPYTFQYKF